LEVWRRWKGFRKREGASGRNKKYIGRGGL